MRHAALSAGAGWSDAQENPSEILEALMNQSEVWGANSKDGYNRCHDCRPLASFGQNLQSVYSLSHDMPPNVIIP